MFPVGNGLRGTQLSAPAVTTSWILHRMQHKRLNKNQLSDGAHRARVAEHEGAAVPRGAVSTQPPAPARAPPPRLGVPARPRPPPPAEGRSVRWGCPGRHPVRAPGVPRRPAPRQPPGGPAGAPRPAGKEEGRRAGQARPRSCSPRPRGLPALGWPSPEELLPPSEGRRGPRAGPHSRARQCEQAPGGLSPARGG